MKKVLICSFLVALVFATAHGLMCYTCDSDDDPGCFSQPEDQRAFLCRIMNVGSESFRCITITATKGDKTVALRRCGIENECELVLDSNNALDWGGEIFPDAQCSICASDYCNNNVGNKISLF